MFTFMQKLTTTSEAWHWFHFWSFSMNMEQTHTISLDCQLSPTWAVIQYSCISHLTMKGGRKSSSYQPYVGPVGGTQVFLHDCRVKTNNSESPTQTLFKKPGRISPSQLCHEDRKKHLQPQETRWGDQVFDLLPSGHNFAVHVQWE